MSFLTLNGLTIPVLQGDMDPGEVGSRQVAFDGSPLIDRFGFKRKWQFTTAPMTESTYNLVKALLEARGQQWFHESEDEYSTKGVGVYSGAYGGGYTRQYGAVGSDPVYDQNGEVDAKSVIAGHWSGAAYTNDVSANTATGGDDSGDTTGFSVLGAGAVTYSTSKAWKGAGSIFVEPSGADLGVTIVPTTMTQDANYLTTFYVMPTSNDTIRVRYKGDATTEGWNDTAVTAGQWTRIVVEDILPAPGNTNPKIDIATTGGNDFYLDGIFTADSFAGYAIPPWVESSITINSTRLPSTVLNNFYDFSFMAWIKMDWTDEDKAASTILCHSGSESWPPYFIIRRAANTDDLNIAWYDHQDALVSHTESALFSDKAWHHIAIAMRHTPASGENGAEIWIDGSSVATETSKYAFDFLNNTYHSYFGVWDGGGLVWYGAIEDVIMFPAAINQEMVTALQTTAWAGLPKLKAAGDFIYPSSVDVIPKVLKAPYHPVMQSGTFAPNTRSIQFELHEV